VAQVRYALPKATKFALWATVSLDPEDRDQSLFVLGVDPRDHLDVLL
jgi:hypothetical protein